MKRKFFIPSILAALLLLSNSCSDYLDVNFDPSNPQVAEGFAILPPIFSQMSRGEVFDTRYVGQYIQNWAWTAANNVWDQHGYIPGSDSGGEKWRSHYWSIGKNIDLIIEQAEAKEQWDYVGVAKAIRAWSWQSTTDVNGEMILTEAWEPNRYVFDYDSQEAVYAEVVRLCEDALKDLARTDGGVSQAGLARGDLVYAGDRAKWTKFVYAVLARNAHHLSNKSNYDPNKVIEYCDKSLASNADNFDIPNAGTSSADGSFWGATRNNLRSYRPTVFVTNLLNGTIFNGVTDPRLPVMLNPSPNGNYYGVTPTKGDTTNATGKVTRIPLLWGVPPTETNAANIPGKYIFKNNGVNSMVTYFEIQFMKAEAAFIKGDKPTAYDAFKKGISAHMEYAGVAAADRDAYMASAAVPQTADALKLSDIMLQKYIALWVHGALETWVDMRRYHYDNQVYLGFEFPATFYLDNGGKPVYRLRPRYNSEYVWNREALDQIGGNNADYHTYELWFSKP
ncbi:MAG: SusD/RagB family nutrient-binding outer membrane lipoprotein [Lewinellaceae bacterium]|nr:SusD/RagB family nutrient-binding outer membrane lipoprotein [Lewinella sp.]MCB9282292.1 SusD/RagB family nutrient-binding outer membrane lipoprotein [Lewinellaceae bacterium]